jgi:hypothetical protein
MNAKQKRRRARMSAIASMRRAFADKNFPRLRHAIYTELRKQVRQIAAVAEMGGRLKISREMRDAWTRDIARIYKQHAYGMIVHAWELAGVEAGGTAGKVAPYQGGAKVEVAGVEIGRAPENFLQKADFPSINKWISSTAASVSETSSTRLENIFTRAFEYYDEEKQKGLTPKEIAAQLLEAGLAQTEARARTLAHTGTMWAYNEGAVQRYSAEGVGVVEWLTADDDLRCPLCAEMNGKRIETGDAFFEAGDSLSAGGLSMKIPSGARGFSIRHPPLHPNCRCALVPVLSAED